MANLFRVSLFPDTRGASTPEYLAIIGTVAVVGLAGFVGLGRGMGTTIGGEGTGGSMATSSQAGEAVSVDHPNPGGGAGNGADPDGFAVGEGNGRIESVAPNILDRLGGGAGGSGGGSRGSGGGSLWETLGGLVQAPRTVGNPILTAVDRLSGAGGGSDGSAPDADKGGGFLDTVVDVVTFPARGAKDVLHYGNSDGDDDGIGLRCLNPLNALDCAGDAVGGAKDFATEQVGNVEDAVQDEVLKRISVQGTDKGDEVCVELFLGLETCRSLGMRANKLPDPDRNDLRVLTLNAANGHECKGYVWDMIGDLDGECEGDSEYYRTADNRKRLAAVANDSRADVIALQEITAGSPNRAGGLDTGLRTAAQANDAFSVFLEGDPYIDYAVVEIGTECDRLPCKQVSPDGTVIYRTDDEGTYISGASICSGGDNRKCPNGAARNKDGSFVDPYFGSWDVADQPDFVDDNGKKKKKTKMPRADGDDQRYGSSTLVRHDQTVTDAYTVVLPPADVPMPNVFDIKVRDELHRYNNDMREAYAGLVEGSGDTEARTALVTVLTAPDGTERVVINVHLAREGEEIQQAQLRAVADLANREEGKGRQVVVTGDFNMDVGTVTPAFAEAGLVHAAGSGIDQVWVMGGLPVKDAHDIGTEGSSDHESTATATVEK